MIGGVWGPRAPGDGSWVSPAPENNIEGGGARGEVGCGCGGKHHYYYYVDLPSQPSDPESEPTAPPRDPVGPATRGPHLDHELHSLFMCNPDSRTC